MQIGNRIFPYPVLNRDASLSDYLDTSAFRLEFDVGDDRTPIIENGEVIFKNLHYTLTDPTLSSLVEAGKLKGAFVVECSASVYRNRFDITASPCNLRISAHEINGNVVASCYLYATEDIPNFKSDGFVPEYSGYTFDIDKFDILAVDDGYKFKIDLDPTEDDKVASIFNIDRTALLQLHLSIRSGHPAGITYATDTLKKGQVYYVWTGYGNGIGYIIIDAIQCYVDV